HLTLAMWRQRGSSNTVSSYTRFLDGADTVNEAIREPVSSGASWPGVSHRIAAYTATSRTQAIQRRSETTSTTTTITDGATIATFDLGEVPAGGDTYDESLSLGVGLDVGQAGAAVVDGAITLGAQAAVNKA